MKNYGEDLKSCPFHGVKIVVHKESDHHGYYYEGGCPVDGCLTGGVCAPEDEWEDFVERWEQRA